MELFTEIYNCYFQIVDEICKTAWETPITEKEMLALASRFGYEESGLTIVPKLAGGNWRLLNKAANGYLSKIDNLEVLPLTSLQKRWLKAMLLDKRIGLFLDEANRTVLNTYVNDVKPLFMPKDFYYYDRFQDGDDFTDVAYVRHFRTLSDAIRKKEYVTIRFHSSKGNNICHTYLPCRMEYSAKNDKFRLLAAYEKAPDSFRIETINLSRLEAVIQTGRTYEGDLHLEELLKASYYKEPVRLLITTKRNTLERTMLHFANYEKQTKKLNEDNYECLIYYNRMMETELLIEILSFGPTIKVLGPENFLNQVKARVKKQTKLFFETQNSGQN